MPPLPWVEECEWPGYPQGCGRVGGGSNRIGGGLVLVGPRRSRGYGFTPSTGHRPKGFRLDHFPGELQASSLILSMMAVWIYSLFSASPCVRAKSPSTVPASAARPRSWPRRASSSSVLGYPGKSSACQTPSLLGLEILGQSPVCGESRCRDLASVFCW